MANFIKAASVTDIAEGAGKTIEVAGKQIALFNVGGKFYAIDNACKHRGGPLGEGEVDGATVICPWHGWEYDVATGANLDDPSVKLGCYPVKVEGNDILIEA
ncbi:MAG: Rieske (2Fe-2S) protein [Candidatus Binatus sp.]|uniref:Rieske (2Fe-2S) protein n=1 Tax=Candidatus Binatus sp. TaxID=2811406 RepID=UPI0027164794|nr:Rieske (2Fe-2S) protein [Candidatus Binatus sp.]MDO8434909.1 Rieske (2Fe-2S) protein [Candidatus Binatus sp.]